jgi:hypothetical protein
MNPRHYIDLKENTRDLQPTYYFMINCLLYSRMETGLVSNQDFYDEDVNVYLAHLLHSFINPTTSSSRRVPVEVRRRRLPPPGELDRRAAHTRSTRRTLTSRWSRSGSSTTRSRPPRRPARAAPAEEAYIGRGKTYYHFAYTYRSRCTGRTRASRVLEKLSVGFEKYIKILSHAGEYLDRAAIQRGRVYHLERAVNETARQD